jgi:hypothetical protein
VGPNIFDGDQHPLPRLEELITAWPKKKDRLARAILAIALKQGGVDLADGGAVSREYIECYLLLGRHWQGEEGKVK